jgi:hypothetical protein
MRTLLASLAALAVVAVPSAAAKDFGPGDLRICNAKRCVPIERHDVLPLLGSFYYAGARPAVVAAPPFGARAYELRFRNGYATGIVAGARLDRFLSYGVNLGRFHRGVWYRIPARLASELRTLTAGMKPLHVTQAALAKSR